MIRPSFSFEVTDMKAIAYYQSLPISDAQALQDIELPEPVA
ncbi:hypothetical protein APX70_08201, partial [Pseudomonas syringae pv. maculicola]